MFFIEAELLPAVVHRDPVSSTSSPTLVYYLFYSSLFWQYLISVKCISLLLCGQSCTKCFYKVRLMYLFFGARDLCLSLSLNPKVFTPVS
jgi:hypothetical protein